MPVAANAQTFSGTAEAIDGDSLRVGGTEIRLHGVDAPEYRQTCVKGGAWACGEEAAGALRQAVQGKQVVCEARDTDVDGRTVARCTANGIDLAESMATFGYAVALPGGDPAYEARAARAKALRVGIWASTFDMPADWRRANPQAGGTPRTVASQRSVVRAVPRAAYPSYAFYSCAQARAAGAAPMYRGQPDYNPNLDGDGDGIACEPYRGRR